MQASQAASQNDFGEIARRQESKTLRQIVMIGVIAFVIGAIAVMVVWAWIVYRYRPGQIGWWEIFEIVHTSIHILFWAFIVGLTVALGAVRLTDWLQYRYGMHLCGFCGRALKGRRLKCNCLGSMAWREHMPFASH